MEIKRQILLCNICSIKDMFIICLKEKLKKLKYVVEIEIK